MIIISDIDGCQDKTKVQYLTKLVCKPQFFSSLHKFMEGEQNNKNKLAFVGNYFDKGSYVISTIKYHNWYYGESTFNIIDEKLIN